MALPSERDVCRKCGGPLKTGFIEGEGPWTQATILWEPATTADSLDPMYASQELAPLPLTRFSAGPRFPARLCPSCRLVEFEYPKLEED